MNSQEMSRLAKVLYYKVKGKANGANEEKVYSDKPSKKYFVGSLCPSLPELLQNKILTRVLPNSVGSEFLVKKNQLNKAKLKIQPSFCVYYKVKPALDEQRKHMMHVNNWKGNWQEFLDHHRSNGTNPSCRILSVFKKKYVEIETLNF
ncbi:MAG: hypothetical protein ACOCZQ_03080, partial [Nanoarchaeota archaeon]